VALTLIALAVLTTEASAQSTTRSFRNSKARAPGARRRAATPPRSMIAVTETTTGD